jgi:hypothetical protein
MIGVSIDKIYLKKVGKVSGFKVWIVDGKYIRDNVEEEFTNYAQHYQFRFIPKDEFWIDKERNPGEEKYFIDSMLVMNRLISKGISISNAIKAANKVEKRERSKSKLMKKEMKIKKKKGNVLKIIYKNLIEEYKNRKIKTWVVNGELVRDLFFLDFTEGGHDKVYSFIPENEVWIDDDLELDERKFVILHELHERNLMSKGKDYDSAHKSSSKIEYYCRKHPKKLDRYIRKEFKKAEKIKAG